MKEKETTPEIPKTPTDTNMPIEKSDTTFSLMKNILAQSQFSLSNIGQKLFIYSFSILEQKKIQNIRLFNNEYAGIKFYIKDFMNAFNIKGGSQRDQIKKGVNELRLFNIVLNNDGDNSGFEKEIGLQFFSASKYDTEEKTISFILSEPARDLLKREPQYFKIPFRETAKLSSVYALRFYLLFSSLAYLADYNPEKNHFWRTLSFDQIRRLFAIDKNQYEDASAFRKRIIEKPIEEINSKVNDIKIISVSYEKEKSGSKATHIAKFLIEIKDSNQFSDLETVLKMLEGKTTKKNRDTIKKNSEDYFEILKELNKNDRLDYKNLENSKSDYLKQFLRAAAILLKKINDENKLIEEISQQTLDFGKKE